MCHLDSENVAVAGSASPSLSSSLRCLPSVVRACENTASVDHTSEIHLPPHRHYRRRRCHPPNWARDSIYERDDKTSNSTSSSLSRAPSPSLMSQAQSHRPTLKNTPTSYVDADADEGVMPTSSTLLSQKIHPPARRKHETRNCTPFSHYSTVRMSSGIQLTR